MNNHKNWTPVLGFIVSHNIKYRKYETYFAVISRFKIPHSQNFLDSVGQICWLEIFVTPQYKLSQVGILHSEFLFFITPTWEGFARQEIYNNGSLHLKHPWVPCNQYGAADEVQCQQIHYQWITKRIKYNNLQCCENKESQLDLFQPSSYFYLVLSTQEFTVVLHFFFTNGRVSCYLNMLWSFFWIVVQG